MKSRDFCFWLQGFLELTNTSTLNKEQVLLLKNHLELVFKHEISPTINTPELQKIHDKIHFPTGRGSGDSSTRLIC